MAFASFVVRLHWIPVVYWRRCVYPLQWRHNRRNIVSNHQPHDCFLNRLFRYRSKKTPMLRVAGLCTGNSPGTGEFPAQMASNAENVRFFIIARKIFPFDDVIMHHECQHDSRKIYSLLSIWANICSLKPLLSQFIQRRIRYLSPLLRVFDLSTTGMT